LLIPSFTEEKARHVVCRSDNLDFCTVHAISGNGRMHKKACRCFHLVQYM
jgi:hypothetical protein